MLGTPLATRAQISDPGWLALCSACWLVVVVGYTWIWPRGTFTDGRRHHRLLSLAYGAVWGACQGLFFMTLYRLLATTGMSQPWLAIVAYFLIGGFNGVWHRFFWDIQVSPPHNYSEWNGRKVLLCHTPNLILSLSLVAIYDSVGMFVLLQSFALAASAWAMRFPAPWDDYSARPGEERSLSTRSTSQTPSGDSQR